MGQVNIPKRLRGQSAAHRSAPAQEERAAKMIGGRTTPGSGAGYQKGDARRRGLVRIECKGTVHDSFRVTRKLVEKLEADTFGSGEVPVMEVELGVRDGKPGKKVYVVPAWAMEDLLERLTGELATRTG